MTESHPPAGSASAHDLARLPAGQETAAAFYTGLTRDFGCDVDLDVVIREGRTSAQRPEL